MHVSLSSAPLTTAMNSSAGSPQQPVERQRASQRGHIQLHVLSADKLMPARKVCTESRSATEGVGPCDQVLFALRTITGRAAERCVGESHSGPHPVSQGEAPAAQLVSGHRVTQSISPR